MEDKNQVAEATKPEEVIELEVQSEVDVDTLKAQLAAAREAKKQILARAHAAESKLKAAKPTQAATSEADIEEYVDLRTQGYDRDDIAFIRRNGGPAALKDDTSLVSIALRAKREQSQAEREAAKVGGAAPTSEVERRFTPAELEAMSVDELRKVLPKAD